MTRPCLHRKVIEDADDGWFRCVSCRCLLHRKELRR